MVQGGDFVPRAMARWTRLLMPLQPFRVLGRILDVGCSLGFLLHQAGQLGWPELHGVEVSDYAAQYARDRFGIRVHHGLLQEDTYPSGFFDVVICSHVLEHVPSPRMLLRHIHTILRPQGMLLLLVPTQFFTPVYRLFGRVSGDGPPLHLFFFSRYTLAALLNKEAFAVDKTEINIELLPLLGSLTGRRLRADKASAMSEEIMSNPASGVEHRVRNSMVSIAKNTVNRLGAALNTSDELIMYARAKG
jgi:SAM-dependent methyltransferase